MNGYVVIVFYLILCLYGKYKKFKVSLKKSLLRKYIISYNIIAMLMNMYVLYSRNIDILLLTKYIELNDTLIMLLRNSYKQITYTHMYHHCSSLLLVSMLRDNFDKRIETGVMMNGGTHMVLYMYYILSFGMRINKKKYLWWSYYLTHMHLTQFLYNTYNCMSMDTNISKIGLCHQISLFVLYGRFFYEREKRRLTTVDYFTM